MIYPHDPNDWRELEELVADLLIKCGLTVQRRQTIQVTRGAVEVDVLATDDERTPPIEIICECKHWRRRVPQTIVHAFRSVVADAGANVGFVISKEGFQAGAYEVAENTSVRLVDWQEFQEAFHDQYYREHFAPELKRRVNRLITFVEPISPGPFLASGRLREENLDQFLALIDEYAQFGFLCLAQFPSTRDLLDNQPITLPLANQPTIEDVAELPDGIREVDNYEQFLDVAERIATRALGQFRELLTE